MNITNITRIVIAAAAIVGVAIGIYMGLKRANRKPWSDVMSKQITLDILTVADIVDWSDPYKASFGEGKTLFLFKATRRNVTKLGYECPEQINPDTNVLASFIDAPRGDISYIQLFSFGKMDNQVKELFGDSDYAVITS